MRSAIRESKPVPPSPVSDTLDGADPAVARDWPEGVDATHATDSDPYFDTMGEMYEAMGQRRFDLAARLVRRNVEQLPAFVGGLRMPAPATAFETDTSGLTIEWSGGPYANDWIYAAAFAEDGRSVWLASYSGRLVCVSPSGRPVHEFRGGRGAGDILELGHTTLASLGGRMVALKGPRCAASLEMPRRGQILATDAGLLVLDAKRLRWFGVDGRFRGGLLASAPIRRIHEAGRAMIVETRTRRARIAGAPPWWDGRGPPSPAMGSRESRRETE